MKKMIKKSNNEKPSILPSIAIITAIRFRPMELMGVDPFSAKNKDSGDLKTALIEGYYGRKIPEEIYKTTKLKSIYPVLFETPRICKKCNHENSNLWRLLLHLQIHHMCSRAMCAGFLASEGL